MGATNEHIGIVVSNQVTDSLTIIIFIPAPQFDTEDSPPLPTREADSTGDHQENSHLMKMI